MKALIILLLTIIIVNAFHLTWWKNNDADLYYIYETTELGVIPFQCIGSSIDTNFDLGIPVGTHFYVVTASNIQGESEFSEYAKLPAKIINWTNHLNINR